MTRRHRAPKPHLTDLQQAILDVLWSKGPATSEQIREALLPDHPLKDPSVRTLLRRLEARGLITHDTDGKLFVYRAVEARDGLAARAVRQIIDRFWSGSTEQFLLGMVDEQVLTTQDLRRLIRKVKTRRGGQS
jgi:BlaI family transcriptional regulator, penicillinase repressor